MTLTLIADEFGLLHAAVPHPCKAEHRIQVMVLQAEDGWWCYVDGERVNGAFASSQHAGQAAAAEIDKLRMLADEVAAGEHLSMEHAAKETKPTFARTSPARRSKVTGWTARPVVRISGTAVAACVALMVLAFTGYVVHATGVLETDDPQRTVASQDDAVTVEPVQVVPTRPAPKLTTAAAAHMTVVAVEAPSRPKRGATLQSAPGRKTTVPALPESDVVRSEPTSQDLPPVHAFPTAQDPHGPGFLAQRTTASLRSSATDDVEEAPVPAVIPQRLVRQPQRAAPSKRKYRKRNIRARAAAKRRARRARRNLRSRASTRSRRAKVRLSRRATRRAIRRVRARKVRRVYRAAFGRTTQR